MSVFDRSADYYDIFYGSKDYARECDFLESAWRHLGLRPETVLDIACGTGNHGLRLAERGYRMSGVDQSAAMLDCYRQKAVANGHTIPLYEQEMCVLALEERFDAAICMFDAIDYLTENADLASFLQRVRAHLRPGGVFVFDFWHAAPILCAHDPVRVREFPTRQGHITRISTTRLDIARQTADVEFHITETVEDQVIADFTETHRMRYFLAQEMAFLLQSSGWEVRHLCPAFDWQGKIAADSWHLVAVAAVPQT